MKRSVLTVFIDGLKPESVHYMPFLCSFLYKKRLRTDLGYSITCHNTMYSGVYPNKHLRWFIWKYSPATSPFAWTKSFASLPIDNLASRYFLNKTTKLFTQNHSFGGIPLLVNCPLRYWPLFDVVEDRLWDEPGYLQQYPTVFDILRREGIGFDVVGIGTSKEGGGKLERIREYSFDAIKPWTYLFIGEVDSYSHLFGSDAPETIQNLKKIDRLLENIYKFFESNVGDFSFICFSDHGHTEVKRKVDIHSFFESRSKPIRNYIHLIEATFARFWFRNECERREVTDILSDFEYGYILTDELLKRYHVDMPDNRYGDLIFYLDAPNIFSKTIWGFGRTIKSMHGYLPDYPEKDGVFVSNVPIAKQGHIELVDILPSLLDLLQCKVEESFDGASIWA